MERIIRNHLALFAFSENNEIYMQNAEELSRSLSVIEDKIAHKNENIGFYCNMTRLNFNNNRDYLTLCIKNNKIYLGFYDKNEKRLSFYDDKHYLEQKSFANAIAKLETNIIRDLNNNIKAVQDNLFIKQTIKIWEPAVPLLDKIQEIDKQIHALSEKERDRLFHSLQYDQYIDMLIEKYENMDSFDFYLAMQLEQNPFIQKSYLEPKRHIEIDEELMR